MAALPEPWKSLRRALEVLSERVKKLENTSPFSGTGLSVPGSGLVQADGELVVNGPIDVHGDANFDGDTTIGGNAAITGTLSLPAGIINNDALAEPLRVARLHDDASSFTVPTGVGAAILSASVPVPAGFSQAIVLNLAAAVTAINSTASTDFLYIYGAVNGSAVGWQIGSPDVPAGTSGVAYDLSSQHLTGLAGGTLTVTATVSTGFATWAPNASNVANLDAAVLFLR